MKNSILMGSLVVAMALLPSFASAATTAYDVVGGDVEVYLVPGSMNVQPSLDEKQGDAEIVSAVFLGTQWRVEVECLESAPTHCLGDIVS